MIKNDPDTVKYRISRLNSILEAANLNIKSITNHSGIVQLRLSRSETNGHPSTQILQLCSFLILYHYLIGRNDISYIKPESFISMKLQFNAI